MVSFLTRKRQGNAVNLAKTGDIFDEAKSFADDTYAMQVAQIAQYRLATLGLFALCMLLGLAIAVMMPLSKTDLVVIHSAENGLIWAEPPHALQAKVTTAQTESDIVNYVTNRESYSAFTYAHQFRLVSLMSDNATSTTYFKAQDANNAASPIALLGDTGTRRVHIESVIFLDSEEEAKAKPKAHDKPHQNLAQVNFVVTTSIGDQETQTPYVALLSWTYLGTPDDPEAKWQNWDGFTVTEYSVSSRVVGVTK